MHLTKVKLAGFKSFVDPTVIELRSHLTGVVGPNGCGKSNIVDAVRWVIGESSAKNLRSENMDAVIFNGTTQRKPVAQASVELLFDNSDGSIGGEYSGYAQISVRRVVVRGDGSTYFLNGTRCRLRDIQDVFLGTGLGPRSYSIIGQDEITKLIQAKPEEMRSHLEEVAGISKYRERRRETESRIRKTRDNLDRLNDIREELEKQLSRLQRQAKAAERYKVLKEEERLLKAQLLVLHWQAHDEKRTSLQNGLSTSDIALEKAMASQRENETEIEKARASLHEALESCKEVERDFYRLGAEVARLEQDLQHYADRESQLKEDLGKLSEATRDAQKTKQEDCDKIDQLESVLVGLTDEVCETIAVAKERVAQLNDAEKTMQAWQVRWDQFQSESAKSSEAAQVASTLTEQLQRRLSDATERKASIQAALDALKNQNASVEVSTLEGNVKRLSDQCEHLQSQLNDTRDGITHQRTLTEAQRNELSRARGQLENLQGRYDSLDDIQQVALGKDNEQVNHWLQQHALNEAPRLAQAISVDQGWELAVEVVLGGYLEAVCAGDLSALAVHVDQLGEGAVRVLGSEAFNHEALSTWQPTTDAHTLVSKITSTVQLEGLLAGVYVADTMADALSLLANLAPYESVITRDGAWVGQSWMQVGKSGTEERSGLIEREQQLRALREDITVQEGVAAQAEEALTEHRQHLAALEEALQEAQTTFRAVNTEYSEESAQLKALQTKVVQQTAQQHRLDEELGALMARITDDETQWAEAQATLLSATQCNDAAEAQRQSLTDDRACCQNALAEAKEQARQAQQHADTLNMRLQSQQNEVHFLKQSVARVEEQLSRYSERQQGKEQALSEVVEPVSGMKQSLEASLKERLEIETRLTSRRQGVQSYEDALRTLEGARQTIVSEVDQARTHLEQMRLQVENATVRCATYEEQIADSDFELNTLVEAMPEEAALALWEEQVEAMVRRINRLGPINLAAIDEFETQSERKIYLDKQNDDLVEALETLEKAIHKIDRETRQRFKETFDRVNVSLGELFPKVFGGGRACLELTDEHNLLDTGVVVVAQPPGKRNTTINMLSGGEKALSAIALVFSLFRLNPAPFCILDEVDAPLDDVNVGRYCRLVSEMAEDVQFLFITHNKIAMEMADQLIGVTMHEPGASRLVSVDINEALTLTETVGA